MVHTCELLSYFPPLPVIWNSKDSWVKDLLVVVKTFYLSLLHLNKYLLLSLIKHIGYFYTFQVSPLMFSHYGYLSSQVGIIQPVSLAVFLSLRNQSTDWKHRMHSSNWISMHWGTQDLGRELPISHASPLLSRGSRTWLNWKQSPANNY